MVEKPDAKVIFLKQTKAGTLELARYAVKERARGCVLRSGDQLVTFMVDATFPEGPVLVTDTTKFVFAG